MRIAVTGSAGKLGQAVVSHLVETGHSVTGLDAVGAPGEGFVRVDLADSGQVLDALAGVEERYDGLDAVVHLAASPAPGIRPDTVLLQDNLAMTIAVFQAARRAGITRIVHASSETLLGLPLTEAPPAAPIDEAQPTRPNFMYAIGKHLEEELGRKLCRLDADLSITGLRFSNVMAPDDYAEFDSWQDDPAVRRWNLWGYIDRRDGAHAVERALAVRGPGYETYIIAAADTVMRRDSAELMAAEFPRVPLTRPLAGRETLLSIDAARRDLGYAPRHSWLDGR
ncbi:NAD-dependent epimerase/dehydratase family protein [Microcella humidisoli]|uniref:NAD(P)-dependent oxidoreductase n=1 Tax=Microcella humidisoli TaxID=2963406 RepID=A0ABY5FYJ3_9MICO|nr:NAD(P)-dependent oxidoreductase [Microcella humidisoli]UTT63202.1 NAD(P)-dependent oxidoreductase [Microcella humidisoli]